MGYFTKWSGSLIDIVVSLSSCTWSFVDPIYEVILYPYLLSFGSFNNIYFGFLIVLFAFVGNNFDQECTAKRSTRGSKEEKK